MNLFSTTLKRPARRIRLDDESAAEVLLSEDVPTIPPPTDRELLTLWLEHKDTSALEAIIRRHGPLVRSLSSRLLRSHHEQADAFQTVFLVVSQNASRIRHRESLASWIYGVTVRTCLMFSRQRSRHDPIPEEAEAPSFPRQEVLEHQELVLTLNKELDLLPSHLRESLVLVYLEGYSRQAAADLTNTTEQTIKSRLARGRNLLRTRLLKRGVTFSTAFTLFSVTTTADADTLTIPDLLLNKTLDTCQSGQLPLTFPSVPLAPIAIVPTGVPLMSSTTFYGTLAVATLLLLTTLGMGNRGKADGQTQQPIVNTAISDEIEFDHELATNIILNDQPTATELDNSSPASDVIPTVAAAPQVPDASPDSSATPKPDPSAQPNPEPVKNASQSMELQLLDLEIEMLQGSISNAEAILNRARNEPEFLKMLIGYFGTTGDLTNATHEEQLKHFSMLKETEIETSKKQLEESLQYRKRLLAKTAPASEATSVAEIEVRRLDSLIAQKKQIYERILLAKLSSRGGTTPPDVSIDNRITSLDPEKIDELKFEILKLAIEKQQAEQALQSMQTASPTPSLPAPVGSAVQTVGPPTTPVAPPAVADVDLSPNSINPQPTSNLPPLKQHEQSLLDLKVERAELQLNSMQRLAESNPVLVSSNDLQLKLLDAKIALQEALLERERFRVHENTQLTDKANSFLKRQNTGMSEGSSSVPAVSLNSNDADPSKTSPGNKLTQTKLAEFYPIDEIGKRLSDTPVFNIDDFKGVNLGGNGEITFIVDNFARSRYENILRKYQEHRFVVQIGNENYPVNATPNALIVESIVTSNDAKQILAYFDGRGVEARNTKVTTNPSNSPAQAQPSADKLKIRLNSEVPLTAIYKDPSNPTKEITLDINDSRPSIILGEFPNARTEIALQTKSQTTGETFSYPVVLEFRDGIDLSKIPLFFNTVQIDLTQNDYELLRQSRFEVYLYTVERPGRKQIAENGRFVEGPNETLCVALPRGRTDNARLSDEAFRKVVESKQTIIATLRSAAVTPTESQPANPPTPTPAEKSPTPKTLGVKFSNDFNAKITFDKLTLPEADTGAPQPIPAGVHPVTLTYKSSDNDQTFSQPLILEVLPEINELDVGDIAGEFRLTLYELALIQQGLFGRALVVYGTPNERVTAAGRVGSGAAVSEINTILDLEAIRSKANEFSRFERSFGREGQPKGRIVAILHSPDYDEKIRFRHQFYLPSRGGTRNGLGRMDWTLLTPNDIPAIGTVVELFHVNADASSIDELRIVAAGENAPATRQYKIGEVTANEIYLSQIDQNIGSLQPDPNTAPLRPLSRLFFPQQARDQDLILVPKDKYTPETLSTEIWNKLHPPAKD